MARILGLVGLAILVVFLSVPSANADTTTYTYTGNPFTDFTGTLPAGVTGASGSLTFADPLPANIRINFNGIGCPPGATGCVVMIPLSYSFTDGATTYTQSNSGCFAATCFLITDPTGAIVNWGLFIGIDRIDLLAITANTSHSDDVQYRSSGTILGEASNDTLGTWVVTPEPSSLLLLGIGLAALTRAVRRKQQA